MMKRIVAFLTLVSLFSLFIVVATASTVEFSYDGNGNSFVKWSNVTTSVGTDWKVSSWETSNLGSNRTADVKIYHAPGVYASHTWTYNSNSTKPHGYTAYSNGQDVYMAGHKKSGSGNVTVSGEFEP